MTCHSEASASEWHENLKEMFLLYYIESDVTNKFNFSTTYKYVTYGENDAPSSIFKIHFSTKSQSSSNHTVYRCWMVSLVYSKVTNAIYVNIIWFYISLWFILAKSSIFSTIDQSMLPHFSPNIKNSYHRAKCIINIYISMEQSKYYFNLLFIYFRRIKVFAHIEKTERVKSR